MNVLYLIIGWVLGIFSPILAEGIKNHFKRKITKQAIIVELGNIRKTFIQLMEKLIFRYCEFDREQVGWFIAQAKRHCSQDKNFMNKVEIIDNAMVNEDEIISQLWKTLQEPENMSIGLTQYKLPFLEANLSSLTLFDTLFQNNINEIRTGIDIINGYLERGKFYFEKTFDSTISVTSHKNLLTNMRNGYKRMPELLQNIIEMINTIERG